MQKKLLVLVLVALGSALILFHERIIANFQNIFAAKDTRPVIASIDDMIGEVQRRAPLAVSEGELKSGSKIRHQDGITTGQESRAIVRLEQSGLVLEIEPQSSVVFELTEYVLITFQRGTYKVIQKGEPGPTVLVLKDGVLQDPLGRSMSGLSLLQSPAPQAVPDEEKPVGDASPSPQSPDENSLSDLYISTTIQNQKGFFGRCYALHLRNNPKSRGEMHLSFTIQSNGEVKKVKILKTTLEDAELQKCTASVIERTRYQSFTGPEIVVNYPIYFE